MSIETMKSRESKAASSRSLSWIDRTGLPATVTSARIWSGPGGSARHIGCDARSRGDGFGREHTQYGREPVEILDETRDVAEVGIAVGEDLVRERGEPQRVGARADRQVLVGRFGGAGPARVDD